MKQLDHYSSPFTKQTFPITLVCENVTNAPNIGSLFRTSDAFGIEKLLLCGTQIPFGRKMTKTSRATEKSVPYEILEDSLKAIAQLKNDDYKIVALEITDNSQPFHSYKFETHHKYALLIGDENFGISETLLKHADTILHIDMYGQNSSMNVVQATTIALYEMTRQLLS